MADFVSSVGLDASFTLGQFIDPPLGGQEGNPQFYWVDDDVEAVAITYRNRVWDAVFGGHVRWDTPSAEDLAGAFYPGPGAFGVTTSDYCVESIY